MFDRTHTLLSCHFICHYTDDYYFLLINAKPLKTVLYIGRASFESDFAAYHDNTM